MAKAAAKTFGQKTDFQIRRVNSDVISELEIDLLAVEEPLEIRVGFKENNNFTHKAISITMRTPDADIELAAGFLFTEGILQSKNQIKSIKHCGKFPNNQNTIRVDLAENVVIDFQKMARNFYTTSSCGVCGKSSLEALQIAGAKPISQKNLPNVSAEIIHRLPETLKKFQTVFAETGGLHAAALFDFAGNLIDVKEDVGRHNAVDKLIGKQFLDDKLPISEKILFLSGRASFELVQKAVMAQIPVICAVGAPSSLAVEVARKFNIVLLGFVRERRFNIYNSDLYEF
ncbi:MAG TPA: formate dehydrogenase accessory sulfurtransferase FdhD [Pyrinomonadaceae bacterium]|nr:formate dehydrogenase accessory sulfurtransferase FdhD [Pyrinomonadaceae bacterium]